jgi:hypothetical protein
MNDAYKAWDATAYRTGLIDDRVLNMDHVQWLLLSTPGSVSPCHIDGAGVLTYFTAPFGAKLLLLPRYDEEGVNPVDADTMIDFDPLPPQSLPWPSADVVYVTPDIVL